MAWFYNATTNHETYMENEYIVMYALKVIGVVITTLLVENDPLDSIKLTYQTIVTSWQKYIRLNVII